MATSSSYSNVTTVRSSSNLMAGSDDQTFFTTTVIRSGLNGGSQPVRNTDEST
jgi:hypothetical protein